MIIWHTSSPENDVHPIPLTRVTDEGLVIELFELEGRPLFVEKTRPTRLLEDLTGLVAQVANLVENDIAVTAHARAVMMIQLKLARIKTSPEHADHWIDVAGYAACGGEVAVK